MPPLLHDAIIVHDQDDYIPPSSSPVRAPHRASPSAAEQDRGGSAHKRRLSMASGAPKASAQAHTASASSTHNAQIAPAVSHAASITAAPHIGLSRHSGPPTSTVRVSGAGFGAYRAVDIYFGTKDKALASTNGDGAFSGVPVKIPAMAAPGRHYITAVQRHSGRSAQAGFLVNTNWAQFGYSASRNAFNPYENVLSRSNVSGVGLAWSLQTGSSVQSSPAVVNGVVYIGSNDGHVYALNAATGAKRWSFTTKGIVDSSPAVVNGVVYIGSSDQKVYALDYAVVQSLAASNRDCGPSGGALLGRSG